MLVQLRAISGHRDTGFTECPGTGLYRRLPSLARNAAAAGLPKLYAPSVSGSVGGRVRFAARLSASLDWRVTVSDASGETVASGSGSGTRVAWTWDSAAAPRAPYSWVIEAPGARPARGTIGSRQPPLPLLSELAASPPTVTPNEDGQSDFTTIRYRLGTSAIVTITFENAAGATVATLLNEAKPAGRHALRFTAASLPDGRYLAVFTAQADDGKRASASVPVVVSRILRAFAVEPERFSPNGDGVLDRLELSFELTAPAEARVEVRRKGRVLATPLEAGLDPGPQQVRWAGTTPTTAGSETAATRPCCASATPPQRSPCLPHSVWTRPRRASRSCAGGHSSSG